MSPDILTQLAALRKSYPSDNHRQRHHNIINAPANVPIDNISVPDLRKLALQLLRDQQADDALQTIASLPNPSHETKTLWGLILAYQKTDIPTRIQNLNQFARAIDNWAECDTVAATCKWLKSQPQIALDWTTLLIHQLRDFEVRFGLVLAIDYIRTTEHRSAFLSFLQPIDYSAIQGATYKNIPLYYVRMAVAWLLATWVEHDFSIIYQWTHNHLNDPYILKLYHRKVRESLRVRHLASSI